MEFIMEHYIWFLIGGIILIMTLIGYIADKTEYIEKEKEKKKNKQKKLQTKMNAQKSKEQEEFEKEIGTGEDLVLTEAEVSYPLAVDDNYKENYHDFVDTSLDENFLTDGIDFELPSEKLSLDNTTEDIKEENSLSSDNEMNKTEMDTNLSVKNEENSSEKEKTFNDDIWKF